MMKKINQKNISERRKMMITTFTPENQNHYIIKNIRKFVEMFFKIKKIKNIKYG